MSAAPSIARASFARGVRAVAARELSAAFDSGVALVALALSLVAVTSVFMNEFFLARKLDLAPLFDLLPLALVLLAPALSMRTWSEDLRSRTFELWATLPLSNAQLVLGKFASTLVLHALFLAGTLPCLVLLEVLGSPDLGRIASGYAGAFLLGGTLLALGQFLSSLTSDQVTAFVGTAFASFALLALGAPRVVAVLDGIAPALGPGTWLAANLSALPRYESFVRGEIALAGVAYFTGLAAAFLCSNARALEASRK